MCTPLGKLYNVHTINCHCNFQVTILNGMGVTGKIKDKVCKRSLLDVRLLYKLEVCCLSLMSFFVVSSVHRDCLVGLVSFCWDMGGSFPFSHKS